MTTLFDYWRSSASYRVRIALGMSGEAWQSQAVDLLQAEQVAPAHLARNPQGLVPALEIDGDMFTQSLAILEYLDETRGLGLLPEGPAARARVRALSYAIAMEIHPVCNLRVARFASQSAPEAITMESWMRQFMQPGLEAVEVMMQTRMSQSGRFAFGDAISMADLCLVPQVYNAERWGIDLSAMPRIREVYANLQEVEAVRMAHPDRFSPASA